VPEKQLLATIIEASKPIVAVIGPWNKDRLKAPLNGKYSIVVFGI
jgi:hypothetical protein